MKRGLLLIDIQNDYFEGGKMELAGMDRASANAQALLGEFRSKDWPVFHVQHISPSPAAGFFLPNTVGVEIHTSVAPGPGERIIQKHFPNAFRETQLLEHLRNAGVEELVLCGAMSHMCVDATTRAASDLGFRCIVVEDACAARDLSHQGERVEAVKVHAAFMAALAAGYARVLPLKEWLQE